MHWKCKRTFADVFLAFRTTLLLFLSVVADIIAYDILSPKIRQNDIFRERNLSRVWNWEVQHFKGKKYGKIILFEWIKPLLTKHTTLPIFGPYFLALCSTIFHANFYLWYQLDHPHTVSCRCVLMAQQIERHCILANIT